MDIFCVINSKISGPIFFITSNPKFRKLSQKLLKLSLQNIYGFAWHIPELNEFSGIINFSPLFLVDEPAFSLKKPFLFRLLSC